MYKKHLLGHNFLNNRASAIWNTVLETRDLAQDDGVVRFEISRFLVMIVPHGGGLHRHFGKLFNEVLDVILLGVLHLHMCVKPGLSGEK